MSLPPYEVTIDLNNNVIHIIMRGFWTVDIVHSYFDKKNSTLNDYLITGKSIDSVRVLIDTIEWEVQQREVAELIDSFENKPVKTAVINRSDVLPRRQAQRIASEGYKFFLNKEEAMNWLVND